MKRVTKFLLVIALTILTCKVTNAQDLKGASDTFNEAAKELNGGNNSVALEGFKNALNMCNALGEEGAELAGECKKVIPQILLQLGKDAAVEKNLDKAVEYLKEAEKLATEYGQPEVAKEAKELVPQIYIADGNSLLNEGKFDEAAAEYEKATLLDTTNAVAFLRLGMAKARINKEDEAIAALTKAAELGEKEDADKQISNIYAKKAVAAFKAKNNAGALESALKANEYSANPQVSKIGGICAFNLKKYNDAIKLLEPLVTNDAKSNDIKYYLARAYEGNGNSKKACEYYKLITTDAKFKEFAESKVKTICK